MCVVGDSVSGGGGDGRCIVASVAAVVSDTLVFFGVLLRPTIALRMGSRSASLATCERWMRVGPSVAR